MNNVCECKEYEEIVVPKKCKQPSLMDMYERLNKLELENQFFEQLEV